MALTPLNLLVSHDGRSSRQHVTCRFKCGDACSKPVPNTSDNEYFGDVVKALSRRSVLQAGGIAVLAVGAGSALAACGSNEQPVATPTTLVRGANSFFVNDEDAEAFAKGAPGFQRTHVVADSGHSVQGDQPAALVEILRGVLGRD